MERITAQDLVLNVLKSNPEHGYKPSEVSHSLEGKVNRQYVYDILHILLKKGALKRENGKYSYVKDPIKGKTIKITKVEADMAAKLGVPLETYAKEKLKQRRVGRPRTQKIDWERLARNLQKALRDEMDENQKRANDIEALLFKISSLNHQITGFQAVISYLESKNGNNPV